MWVGVLDNAISGSQQHTIVARFEEGPVATILFLRNRSRFARILKRVTRHTRGYFSLTFLIHLYTEDRSRSIQSP